MGPARTEGLAIAALVLALLSFVIPVVTAIPAFVVAVVAARKIRRAPAGTLGGRGLVIAANIVAAAGLLLGVGIVALIIVAVQSEKPTALDSVTAAAVPSEHEVSVESLRVGDCINDATIHKRDDTEVGTVKIVPCWLPHDLEVYANRRLQGESFPGDEKILSFMDQSCSEDFESYVGIPPDDSQLDYFAYVPSRGSWEQGDRLVTCGVVDPGEGKLNGSARESEA